MWLLPPESTVIAALLRLLSTTLEATGQELEPWTALGEQADLLVSAAEREIAEPADPALVHSGRAALELAL